MATWTELSDLAGRFGGSQLSPTMWMFDLPGAAPDITHKVFVAYEVMKPDLEFIQIRSAVVNIDQVHTEAVLKGLGQMLVGGFGFAPTSDETGMLVLTTSIPLAALTLQDPMPFFLYLNVLARSASDLNLKLA